MTRISNLLLSFISANPILKFGFQNRLFNLSQLARFLQPQIESRLKKTVQTSAITMNLSRLQTKFPPKSKESEDIKIRNISVRDNLGTITFHRLPENDKEMTELHTLLNKETEYSTFSQSTSEITICCNTSLFPKMKKMVEAPVKYENTNISALRIQFPEQTACTPGMVFLLVQSLSLQGINLVEISSTFTEIIFFVDAEDTKVAFNTLHDGFRSLT